MKASFCSLVALTLLLGVPAIAEEWQLIANSPQGDAVYVDLDSIRQTPQTVTANHYLSSTSSVSRFQFMAHDCRSNLVRTLEVQSPNASQPAWQAVQPSSPLAKAHTRLCTTLQTGPGQTGLLSLKQAL
jgi:hypothetical protein